MFDLPLRVDVATGQRLAPRGTNPYELPWVQGAAATLPRITRLKYPSQIADLREKLSRLKSRGTQDSDVPEYGPRRRPAAFHALDQRPLPSDGTISQ